MNVLLLHGALGSSAQLVALEQQMTPHVEVHALDFEGHGARTSSRPFRMETFAENVIASMDERGIRSAAIFGYSMGGYVALHLAAEMPERVSAIATLGTKFRWDPATAVKESSRLNPDAIRAKVPQFADVLARRHANAGGWEGVLAKTADLLRNLGDHPVVTDEVLARIEHPVLVLVGDKDNTVSAEESRGAAAVMPRASVKVLENTPHPIEQVDVGRLATVLREFFAGAAE